MLKLDKERDVAPS